MMEKINWYREVLEIEPNSKVFFPLARLLVNDNLPAEAIATLEKGIERHPEFLEARLFLIELLYKNGETAACNAQIAQLGKILASYSGFWQAWAACLAANPKDADTASIVRVLAATFIAGPLQLHEVLNRGVNSILQEKAGETAEISHISTASAQTAPVKPADPDVEAVIPETRETEAPSEDEGSLTLAKAEAQDLPAGIPPENAADFSAENAEESAGADQQPDLEESDSIPEEVEPMPAQEEFEKAPDEDASAFNPDDNADQRQAVTALEQENDASLPVPEEENLPEALEISDTFSASAEENMPEIESGIALEDNPAISENEEAEPEAAPESKAAKVLADLVAENNISGKESPKIPADNPDEEGFSLRTRSMADVLAEQGDIQGALDIYNELAAAAEDDERAELLERIETLRHRLQTAPENHSSYPDEQGKANLLGMLEALARRVEARVNN